MFDVLVLKLKFLSRRMIGFGIFLEVFFKVSVMYIIFGFLNWVIIVLIVFENIFFDFGGNIYDIIKFEKKKRI